MATSDLDARFDRILRETHGLIRAHIAGMGVPLDAVDDVAQEVYLDFARDPERIPPEVEVLRWLRGMARNCCHEYFRRHARQHRHLVQAADLLAQLPCAMPDGDELHEGRLAALRRCLDRLSAPHRQLLDAYYRDGKPAAAIAEEQGRSLGAVHMVFSRLREVLRRCLTAQPGITP